MIKFLSKDEIIFLHSEDIELFGGQDGIRDDGMLESALSAPFASFCGNDFYPTIIEKTARLCYCLACDHPFFDGNKRIAADALLMTLELNDIKIQYTQEELITLILSVASSALTYTDIVDWIKKHLKQ